MANQGYPKTQVVHYVFVKKFDGGDFLILMLYVDDMLIVGRDHIKIRLPKKVLSKAFSMKAMGPTRQILGMHIVRDWTKRLLWLFFLVTNLLLVGNLKVR